MSPIRMVLCWQLALVHTGGLKSEEAAFPGERDCLVELGGVVGGCMAAQERDGRQTSHSSPRIPVHHGQSWVGRCGMNNRDSFTEGECFFFSLSLLVVLAIENNYILAVLKNYRNV